MMQLFRMIHTSSPETKLTTACGAAATLYHSPGLAALSYLQYIQPCNSQHQCPMHDSTLQLSTPMSNACPCSRKSSLHASRQYIKSAQVHMKQNSPLHAARQPPCITLQQTLQLLALPILDASIACNGPSNRLTRCLHVDKNTTHHCMRRGSHPASPSSRPCSSRRL
jgi:hypothetical protein